MNVMTTAYKFFQMHTKWFSYFSNVVVLITFVIIPRLLFATDITVNAYDSDGSIYLPAGSSTVHVLLNVIGGSEVSGSDAPGGNTGTIAKPTGVFTIFKDSSGNEMGRLHWATLDSQGHVELVGSLIRNLGYNSQDHTYTSIVQQDIAFNDIPSPEMVTISSGGRAYGVEVANAPGPASHRIGLDYVEVAQGITTVEGGNGKNDGGGGLATTHIHAMIISGVSDLKKVLVPDGVNVVLTGGIAAFGKSEDLNSKSDRHGELKIVPDEELLTAQKVPPLTPNIFNVRIMHYNVNAEMPTDNK